jgi:hypothetical protein
MRAKLLTSLGKSSRSSRKFATDIPRHGCGTRLIIICAALRLRRDELHRSFMVQIRQDLLFIKAILTDSLALTRSPLVKPALAALLESCRAAWCLLWYVTGPSSRTSNLRSPAG